MNRPRPYALVTGASSGIGMEFSRLLAERNYDLVLTARREDRLEALAAELRQKYSCDVLVVQGDLGTTESLDRLLADLRALNIKFKVLINNAGLGVYGDFAQMEWSRLNAMLQVNVIAFTRMMHEFANELRAAGDCFLLNVGSYSAFNPPTDYAAYAGTKAYALNTSLGVSKSFLDQGISVSALCPGFFESEFFDQADHRPSRITRALMLQSTDVARIGLKGLFRGKRVIVPGWLYRIALQGSRLTPRYCSTRFADWIMSH